MNLEILEICNLTEKSPDLERNLKHISCESCCESDWQGVRVLINQALVLEGSSPFPSYEQRVSIAYKAVHTTLGLS